MWFGGVTFTRLYASSSLVTFAVFPVQILFLCSHLIALTKALCGWCRMKALLIKLTLYELSQLLSLILCSVSVIKFIHFFSYALQNAQIFVGFGKTSSFLKIKAFASPHYNQSSIHLYHFLNFLSSIGGGTTKCNLVECCPPGLKLDLPYFFFYSCPTYFLCSTLARARPHCRWCRMKAFFKTN